MRSLLLALLPALAYAAPAPRRVSTLLVPMDPTADASLVQLAAHMNDALKHSPRFAVRSSDELLGLPAAPDATATLRKAEKTFQDARAAFDSRKDDAAAERKLRLAVAELGKGAGALRSCSSLCDAVALYAAALQRRGDVEEAKLILLDLVALSPRYEFKGAGFSKDLAALRTQVATGRMASLRGDVRITTQPAGARVYVDGELKGHSPLTVSALPVGKHLVRLERPGSFIRGEVIEVTPDESELTATLAVAPEQKARAGELEGIARAMTGGTPAASELVKVGSAFGLDSAVLGTVRTLGAGTELSVALFDLKTGKRIAAERRVFQGDEFGQLKSEAARIVNQLLAQSQGGNEKRSSSSDPLEDRAGTEDWGAEDRGGNTRAAEKRKAATTRDPLDSRSGMEDW